MSVHTVSRSIFLPKCFSKQNLFCYSPKRNFGAGDLKIVAARMKSVKSIQKITKAMKMVAASKLKADQRRLEFGLPFSNPVQNLFKKLATEKNSKATVGIIALSSDKGLCGGVNSAVARLCRNTIMEIESGASGGGNASLCGIFGVGDKIRSALHRTMGDKFYKLFTEVTKHPFSFTTAALIAERILASNYERLMIIHNHFRSAIAYDTKCIELVTKPQALKSEKRELDEYEFEPERSDMWNDLHEFYITATLFGSMLDNIASEQSARMSAMDNASSNAGDMLSALTLKYNRARQAKITLELIEIISGAQAL